MSNVVVLSESSRRSHFEANMLGNSSIELVTPRLDGDASRPFSLSTHLRTRGRSTRQSDVNSDLDVHNLKRLPAGSANWYVTGRCRNELTATRISLEVHENSVYAVFVRDKQPIWRLQVVGHKIEDASLSRGVGFLGHNLKSVSPRCNGLSWKGSAEYCRCSSRLDCCRQGGFRTGNYCHVQRNQISLSGCHCFPYNNA